MGPSTGGRMARADKNHWGTVTAVVLCSAVATGALLIFAGAFDPRTAAGAVIFYGGVLALSVATLFAVRRATSMRQWWLLGAVLSPVTMVLVFTLLVNLSMRLAPVTPSYGDGGIPGPWNEKYSAGLQVGSNDSGTFFNLQNKTIWVSVGAKGKRDPSNDKIVLHCCFPSGTVIWLPNDGAEITLYQEGLNRTGADAQYNDSYSVALAKSGKRAMVRLTYGLDPKTGKFVRTHLEVLDPAVVRTDQ